MSKTLVSLTLLLCSAMALDAFSAIPTGSIKRPPPASPFGETMQPTYNFRADNYTVLSSGELSIGNGVMVSGNAGSRGNVYIGSDTRLDGSVYTAGTFDGKNNAGISGDLVYGRDSWINPQVSIGGKVIGPTDAWKPVSFSNPGLRTSGDDELWYGNESSEYLTAGDYSSISAGEKATIYLRAGTYNFNTIWLGNNSSIIADTSGGDVTINAVKGFSTGQNVSISYCGAGSLTFQAGDEISLGSSNQIAGQIRSYGSLSVLGDSSINGSLFANDRMWIGSNTTIIAGGGGVPEPATLLILGAGTVLCLRKRKSTI